MTIDDENVVQFPRDEKPMLTVAFDGASHCRHRQVAVSERDRTVTCTRCNAQIDPIDYICQLARKSQNAHGQLRTYRSEVSRAAIELRDLKRRIRNADARLKRRLAKLEQLDG